MVLVSFGSPDTHDSSCTTDALVRSALNVYYTMHHCDLNIVKCRVSLLPSETWMWTPLLVLQSQNCIGPAHPLQTSSLNPNNKHLHETERLETASQILFSE